MEVAGQEGIESGPALRELELAFVDLLDERVCRASASSDLLPLRPPVRPVDGGEQLLAPDRVDEGRAEEIDRRRGVGPKRVGPALAQFGSPAHAHTTAVCSCIESTGPFPLLQRPSRQEFSGQGWLAPV